MPTACEMTKLRNQAAELRAHEQARAGGPAEEARLLVRSAKVWELAEDIATLAARMVLDRSRLRRMRAFVEHGGKAIAESIGGEVSFCRRRADLAPDLVGEAGRSAGADTGFRGDAGGAPRPGAGVDGAALDLRQRLTKAGALRVPGADVADRGEDAWTTSVVFDVAGRTHRDFADAVARQVEEPFGDRPFEGPRTLVEYLQMTRRKAPTPGASGAYHTKWLAESGLAKKSIEAHVHELGVDTLESALTYDQLQAGK